MGAVWEAEHVALGTPVAIKLIRPELADGEGARARFLREARAAAALRSPHVVRIFD
jgi:serine/threonine protein kinase